MATSKENKQANDRYREKIINDFIAYLLSEKGGEQWVRQVSSNAIAFPFVNDLGEGETLKITISIPTGDRDGNAYDMDSEADDYERKCAEKLAKQKETAEKKAKKIEADKKKREQKAEMQAKRQQ